MDIDIGMIILGILCTILLLVGLCISVAVIIAAPFVETLVVIFFAIAMVALIIGVWMLILD